MSSSNALGPAPLATVVSITATIPFSCHTLSEDSLRVPCMHEILDLCDRSKIPYNRALSQSTPRLFRMALLSPPCQIVSCRIRLSRNLSHLALCRQRDSKGDHYHRCPISRGNPTRGVWLVSKHERVDSYPADARYVGVVRCGDIYPSSLGLSDMEEHTLY